MAPSIWKTGLVASEAHRPVVELVVLLASAGGLAALSTVLADLPADFPAAIVVQQHLGDHDSVLPTILRHQTARRVSWAQDGQDLAPGQAVVCPPGMDLELTPHGRCHLRVMEGVGVRRFDVLLRSVARSYGPRSAVAVLSGSGEDGAAGAAAMKRAGAIVIAESPDTALYSSMPVAAARAGADLVLPIHRIGLALAGIVTGAPLPEPPADRPVSRQRKAGRTTAAACPRCGTATWRTAPPAAPNSPDCAPPNSAADARTCPRASSPARTRWPRRGAGPRNRGAARNWPTSRPRRRPRGGGNDAAWRATLAQHIHQ